MIGAGWAPIHRAGGSRSGRALLAGAVAVATIAALLLSPHASAAVGVQAGDFAPGRTDLVSVAHDGTAGDGVSAQSVVASGGRYVAFVSGASNLVPEDDNEVADVFLRDRTEGTTELISVAQDDTAADSGAMWPSMSADGRYVAFHSASGDLVAGDTNKADDAFVRDVLTGTTERVSVGDDESESLSAIGAPSSFRAEISDNGRYVAFQSSATNLVPGQKLHCTIGQGDPVQCGDIFVRDRVAGTTQLASSSATGDQGNRPSSMPSISGGGRYVAFYSSATNLIPGDTDANNWDDVYVKDLLTGTMGRASIAADGSEPNDQLALIDRPAISDDGRFVAFDSRASNLVPGDANSLATSSTVSADGFDLFVRDMVTGRTRRVSVGDKGAEGNGYITLMSVSMSADGRYLSFASSAPNLVDRDENEWHDVFVHDVESGTTELVSKSGTGAQGNSLSTYPSISPDGQHITFASVSNNLVPNDGNGHLRDVFVHDRGSNAGAGGITAEREGDSVAVSGWVSFDGKETGTGDDPTGDVPGGGGTGADLVGASVAYRPESNDLLFTWRTGGMPGTRVPAPPRTGDPGSPTWFRSAVPGEIPSVATPAGLAYAASFSPLNGFNNRWEVRVRGTSVSPSFGLYLCSPSGSCQPRTNVQLGGGIGTTGNEVRVAVPITSMPQNFPEGVTLGSVRAFTAAGDPTLPSSTLDSVDLGDIVMPMKTVSLGVAPAGTPAGDVAFDTDAVIAGGRFDGTIRTGGLGGGPHRIWVRTCFGSTCSARSRPLTL